MKFSKCKFVVLDLNWEESNIEVYTRSILLLNG